MNGSHDDSQFGASLLIGNRGYYEGCDAATRSYDFSMVITRKCDIFIVTTRSYAAYFRNYGSHCDRSYGVAASQFYRNRTHGYALFSSMV
jgi:hypothetical protein